MSDVLFKSGEDFPAQSFDTDEELFEDEITLTAKNQFGVRYLFPWQRLVISNIIDCAKAIEENSIVQADENDIICRGKQIVLLPTGAGKSLCFLTPAFLLKGPTLVIYPLLALMADQKRRMEQAGLECVVFKGGQSEQERTENFEKLKNGAKVILANPEVLQDEKLLSRIEECAVSHIAIDEAHCVSEWGDSFRPAYLTLGKIIKRLKVPLVTAFTATASSVVLNRVKEILFEGKAHLVQSTADRPNIHYEVWYAYAKKKAALKATVQFKKPMIVFCSTRRRTEDMARLLSAYYGAQKVRFYHAGLSKEEKDVVEKWFFDSKDGILTATCAYGMGMDKGNIYTVIHLDAPEHLENFIQEAGRAGRKGDNVNSILIWSHRDTARTKSSLESSREKVMKNLAFTRTCRRQFMLKEFTGEEVLCGGCDICDAEKSGKKISYTAQDEKFVFDFIKKNRRLLTQDECIGILCQKLNEKDSDFFKMNVWETKDCHEILNQLLAEQKIKKMGGLWKNRLETAKEKSKTKMSDFLTRKTLHRLHLLRRRLRLLKEQLELPQQLF